MEQFQPHETRTHNWLLYIIIAIAISQLALGGILKMYADYKIDKHFKQKEVTNEQ